MTDVDVRVTQDVQRKAALRAEGMVAGYGDLAVVHGIDLVIHPGEVVALIGPNGAGKSTTLMTLSGELPLAAGSVEWFGGPFTGSLTKRALAGLAFVPEDRSVIMSMTVRDNLLLGSGGVDPAVAVFPELAKLLGRRAGLLSGGEQQMVTLARALAREPKVLLADELSLGLGPMVVDRLLAAIQDAARTLDIGVLIVEQQVRRALAASDRWYLMRQGRMIAEGRSEDGLERIEELYLSDAPDTPDTGDAA